MDFFSHINDQHLQTFCFRLKSQYVPLVCFRQYHVKEIRCHSMISFFFDLISRVSWLFCSYNDCEKTKKSCCSSFSFEQSKYQCWFFFFFLPKANFRVFRLKQHTWNCLELHKCKPILTSLNDTNYSKWMACSFRSKIEGKKETKLLTHNCVFDRCSTSSPFNRAFVGTLPKQSPSQEDNCDYATVHCTNEHLHMISAVWFLSSFDPSSCYPQIVNAVCFCKLLMSKRLLIHKLSSK